MTNGNDLIHFVSKEAVEGDNLGLTKREYFSGLAMQGLLAKEGWSDRIVSEKSNALITGIAEASIIAADALIEALNTPNTPQ